jgi:Holliday junction resolvase-like predicted endonuclease
MSERVKYFRAKAAEAKEAARDTVDQQARRKLLAAASAWTKLAEQAERMDGPCDTERE